jgi:RHS repeat-associated protein
MTLSATCAFSEVFPSPSFHRGEQYDPDLGLYYLRARYLNPVTGRFMSRDPEDGKVKEPATLHKYLYAGGDPVNRIDPRGRETVEYVDLSVKQAWEVETGASEFALRLFACFATISDVVYNSVTDWTVWAAGQDAIGAYFCLK